MASRFPLQHSYLFCRSKSGLEYKTRATVYSVFPSNFDGLLSNCVRVGSSSVRYDTLSRCWLSLALSYNSSACTLQGKSKNEVTGDRTYHEGTELNRVDFLVWKMHESARSFSRAVESLGLAGSKAQLAMAWLGRDVHQWHKRLAYQVAVYALMQTAIDVEMLLSHERRNDSYPVKEILTPLTKLLSQHIEYQLDMNCSGLVDWFRVVELPCVVGFFIPLLNEWSVEYAGSGVAGTVVAITCCAAVGKLDSGNIYCPSLTWSIEDVIVRLMDASRNHVSLEKMHQLAIEAGFEVDFLLHFGRKVFPTETSEDIEFWVGLAYKNLIETFSEESITLDKQDLHLKVPEATLAILGLFAYLGRKTRIYLSDMGINDLDEIVKDFLSYLECGCIFIYSELSSLSTYQHFMEIVTEVIGWLDFYAAFASLNSKEKRRSKQKILQAEQEMILSVVFTVCYDVFSGFAHFNRSSQQPLDEGILAVLLRSQSLLAVCLEDYWAAYDATGEALKIIEKGTSDKSNSPVGSLGGAKLPLPFEAHRRSHDMLTRWSPTSDAQHDTKPKEEASSSGTYMKPVEEGTLNQIPNHTRKSFVRRYYNKLASITSDIWIGTRLLFIDIILSVKVLVKKTQGHKASVRERKILERTFFDVITLVPITVLMLLPVSAVGHAAILAGIKRYLPGLIPSPYSSERLDVVKQLRRTKKMQVKSWSNLDDQSSTMF